jgi:FRG domain
MAKYNYPEHYAKSLATALKLVRHLKSSGKYDLFRGQNHTYPLCPSIARHPEAIQTNTALLNRFASWVHERDSLSSLHDNRDAIMAVAQHYGMPTPFLDFTTDPDVAAFFASDMGSNPRPKQTACILCLNRTTFERSWEDLNARYRADTGQDLVRIVEIDVQNLWRLQAQSGLFIDMRVDANMFEMFSHMLHIYFPLPSHHDDSLNDKYYPKNKSHIEILLDQHFLIETYNAREAQLEAMFGTVIKASDFDALGEKAAFKEGELPDDHQSWSAAALKSWMNEPNEVYDVAASTEIHQLKIDTTSGANFAAGSIHTQMMAILSRPSARNRLGDSWEVRDQTGVTVRESEGDMDEKSRPLGEIVCLLFDGMRLQPYEDAEIANAISNYITLNCFPSWQTMKEWWGSVTGIELDGGSVRARGFCGGSTLVDALRPDFEDLLSQGALAEFEARGIDVALHFLIDPRRLFDMGKFRKLFAEQVIPTTALVRVEGYVFHYNIADIRVFGLS